MRARDLAGIAWTAVSFALLLLTLALASLLLVVPKAVGGVPLTILSDSMRPAMQPGTMVVVRPMAPERLRVGQVVTFQPQSGDATLFTHRIVEVSHLSNGQMEVTTQGDNNNSPDAPIGPEQVMGEVVYAIPYFGWVTNTLNTGEGPKYRQWLAYALLGYAGLMLLRGFIDRLRSRRRAALPTPAVAPVRGGAGRRRHVRPRAILIRTQ